MAADNRPEIVLDGDVSPLRQKLREAAADLKKFGSDGEAAIGRMTGPLGALQSKFIAVGAILAGGAVFKEAVKQAADFTEESMKLGIALGISATEASTFVSALEDIDVSQEDFIGAAKAMSKQIKNNEEVLQSMGLKTRDAAGHLRPLNQLTVEGIEIVKGYKEGTDRAIAGQVMFGKQFQLTGNLLKLNSETLSENEALQRSLGALVGGENVAAWEAFDASGDKAHLTLKAINISIGNALLPVLTDLGNWFVAVGPAAITVIKGALGGLVATFHLVTTGVTVLWETLNAMVVTVAEPIRALGEAIGRALNGDWKGAKESVGSIGINIRDAWGKAMDEMAAKSQSTRDRIWNLFAEGSPSATPGGSGKSATGLLTPPEKKEKAKEAEPSFMSTYEAQLAVLKNTYEQENTLRQFSKTQELAYWRELQENLQLVSKDRTTIAKRTATLELEIRRETAKDMRALDSVMLDSHRAAALAQVESDAQQAQFARDNNEITKLQLLTLEEQFARRRFEIEYQSLLERQELAKNDPGTSPAALAQIKEQMLQIERQYQMQKSALGQSKKKEDGSLGNMFDEAGQSFGTMAKNLLTSATTLRTQLVQVFSSIGSSFVNYMVSKPLGEWLASKAKMLAISLGFMAQETAMEIPASIGKIAASKTEAAAVIPAEAGMAAGAAASSVAGIPIVGPALAAAAYAETFAMVMSGLAVASASKGFDIPHGLNPLTQLHEEEMVLPKVHANTIRRLGEGGGEGGATDSGGDVHLHLQAYDSRDARRFLLDNKRALADALKSAKRDGKS